MLEDCWELQSRNWLLTCVGPALIMILQPIQPYGIKHLALAVSEQIEFFTKYRYARFTSLTLDTSSLSSKLYIISGMINGSHTVVRVKSLPMSMHKSFFNLQLPLF
jgi:hypothetical protein